MAVSLMRLQSRTVKDHATNHISIDQGVHYVNFSSNVALLIGSILINIQCNFAEGVCGPEISEITMLSELAPLNSRAPYSSNQALLLPLYRLTLIDSGF